MQSPAGYMTKVMLTFGTWQMACGALHCNHLSERDEQMRTSPFLVTATLATSLLVSAPISAENTSIDIKVSCDARSDYQVSMSGQAFVFENNDGRNTRVVLGGGQLYINGKQTAVSAADQKSLDGFEAELRLLVPESRQVVTEAVNIAFDALGAVSVALSGNAGKSTEYDKARAKAVASANDPTRLPIFNDQSMRGIVEPIVSEFVPDIVGSALGFAMKAIFAGEEKAAAMETRMNAMEKDLDARIDAREKALEPLAEGMCKRIQRMDALDNALEVRLPNGKPIDFLSIK